MGKKEYITIGIKTITKELFRNVLRPLDNQTFRPDGGLWASDYRPYTISPWLQYLINNQEYYSHKDIKRSKYTNYQWPRYIKKYNRKIPIISPLIKLFVWR